MPYGFAQDPVNSSDALGSDTYSYSTLILHGMGGPMIQLTLLMPLMHEQHLQLYDIICMPYGWAQDPMTLLMPLEFDSISYGWTHDSIDTPMPLMSNTNSAIRI